MPWDQELYKKENIMSTKLDNKVNRWDWANFDFF